MTKDYTDFREANDSPLALLRAKSAERFQAAKEFDPSAGHGVLLQNGEPNPDYVRGQEFAAAAIYLMSHEVQNGVTFVALENSTLDWLIELVDDFRNEKDSDEKRYLAETAVRVVVDLLGLED